MEERELQDQLDELHDLYRTLSRQYRELAIRYTQIGGELPVPPAPRRRRKSDVALTVIKGGAAGLVAWLAWLFAASRRHHALVSALTACSMAVTGAVVFAAVESSPPAHMSIIDPAPTPLPLAAPSARHRRRRDATKQPERPRGTRTALGAPKTPRASTEPYGGGEPLPMPTGGALPSTQPQPAPTSTSATPRPRPSPHRRRHCRIRLNTLGVKVCV